MKVRWAIGALGVLLGWGSTGAQDPCCIAPLNLGFSTAVVRGAPPFEGVEGLGPDCEASLATVDHVGTGPLKVFVNIITQLGPEAQGASGFSLSIRLDGAGDVLSATTAGTAADWWHNGGFFQGGFHRTEVIDPARNEGRKGVVSHVVFDLDGTPWLPPRGTESVLALELTGPEGSSSLLSSFDGLKGSGQPVTNYVIVLGNASFPCNRHTARIAIRHLLLDDFIRGNANGDLSLDIGDPVWILNDLFHEGRPSPCADAADSNDDGRIDISDAVHLIRYLFLTGEPPPQPYPECGLDPTEDEIDCVGGASPC